MSRELFYLLCERAAVKRFTTAQAAMQKHVMQGFQVMYPPSSHWDELERLKAIVERERKRHRRWLNYRLSHDGLPLVA